MAIVQISKIQQRSGNLVDLPQLDVAEIGLATDAKRLFIGNDNTSDGVENIEVLTSYSSVDFNQINGSSGNLDINSPVNGQVLAYDGANWTNKGGVTGGLITLGSNANVTITGGTNGQVLTTDGAGHLSWTAGGGGGGGSAAGSDSQIQFNSSGSFGASSKLTWVDPLFTVDGNISVGNNISIANNITAGKVLTLTVATGTAPLAVTSTTRVNNLNVAYANVSDWGKVTARTSGTYYPVFASGSSTANYELGANSSLSFNAATGALSATLFTGTLTTAAQPNITSVGTLTSLVVGGHITPSANITYDLGNNTNRFRDLYLAGSTIYLGAQTINGNTTSVTIAGNVAAGNLSGTLITGTLATGAQPNITSIGSLTSVTTAAVTTGASGTAGTLTGTWSMSAGSSIAANLSTGATAVTQTSTDNSTKIATTAFVQSVTGNFKMTEVNSMNTGGTNVPSGYLGSMVYLTSAVDSSETTLPTMTVGVAAGQIISFTNVSSFGCRIFPGGGNSMKDHGSAVSWFPLYPNQIVQMMWDGTQWVILSDGGLGDTQTWSSFTSPTRTDGVTYTNTTGKPIMVSLCLSALSGSPGATIYVHGSTIAVVGFPYGTNQYTFVVPIGLQYSVTLNAGTGISTWSELR